MNGRAGRYTNWSALPSFARVGRSSSCRDEERRSGGSTSCTSAAKAPGDWWGLVGGRRVGFDKDTAGSRVSNIVEECCDALLDFLLRACSHLIASHLRACSHLISNDWWYVKCRSHALPLCFPAHKDRTGFALIDKDRTGFALIDSCACTAAEGSRPDRQEASLHAGAGQRDEGDKSASGGGRGCRSVCVAVCLFHARRYSLLRCHLCAGRVPLPC